MALNVNMVDVALTPEWLLCYPELRLYFIHTI